MKQRLVYLEDALPEGDDRDLRLCLPAHNVANRIIWPQSALRSATRLALGL
jgi:hypothetical protein